MKRMALGGGGRFAALKGKLAGQPGVTNPGALAAAIGRKKYGAEKMEDMAEAGMHRAEAPGAHRATSPSMRTAAMMKRRKSH